MLNKLRKLAALLIFVGGVVLCFSQNSAANVYADSYEDQYSKGTYTFDVSRYEEGEKVQISQGQWQTLVNTMDYLAKSNSRVTRAYSGTTDNPVYTYELTGGDSTTDKIELSKNIHPINGSLYYIKYVSGFDYRCVNGDSDSDGVKDILMYNISSYNIKNDSDYKNKPYFSELIIKPYNCQITIDPNGGQFKDGNMGCETVIVPVGTTFEEIITDHSEWFSTANTVTYGISRDEDFYKYDFAGFSFDKNATEPSSELIGSYKFNMNKNIYVTWKKTDCIVNIINPLCWEWYYSDFVQIGTTLDELIISKSDYFGGASDAETLTYSDDEYGYNIWGFSKNDNATEPDAGIDGSFVFNDTESLYTIWKKEKCHIIIDANGGKLKNRNSTFSTYVPLGTKLEDIIADNGEVFSDASENYGITRASDDYEYELLGFSTNKNATVPDSSIDASYSFNEYTVLYAVWKKVKCRVIIDANGGELKNGNSYFSQYVPIGTTFEDVITGNSGVFSSDSDNYGIADWTGSSYGYRFKGFAFDKNASLPNSAINASYTFGEAKRIYAIYDKYAVVTFDLSGKGDSITQKIELNNKISKPADPVAEGCEFVGWYTVKTGKSFSRYYNPGASSMETFDFNTEIKSNTTLYAGWKINYKMIGYNGGLCSSGEFYLDFDGKLYLDGGYYSEYPNYPEDHLFIGWYSEPESTNCLAFPGQYRAIYGEYSSEPESILIEKSMTVYAGFGKKLDAIEYSVNTPLCGTKITTNETYLFYNYSEIVQNNSPEINVPGNACYEVVDAYWLTDNLKYPSGYFDKGSELLNGFLNGEDTLYGVMVLKPKKGYAFMKEDTIGKNTETKVSTSAQAIDYSLMYMPFSVKAEHDWNAGEITKKPTCKMMGIKTFKCNHCPATKTEDIDMTEHKWGKGVVVREATSEKTGLKSYTCEICGDAKYEDIPKLTSAGLSKKESEAVDQLNKEIDYLPDADDVTLENAEKIKELVKEYDKMTEKQKEVIQGDKIKKLMQAYNKITILELEAADPDSEMNTDKAVNVLSDGGDLKNSTFADLQVKAKAKKNSITLSWKKVPDAKGYLVYGNLCGKKNKMIKIKATSDTKLALDKINGKAIEGGKYYKFIVVAYKDTQKFKHNIALSKSLHVATPGGKYTNVKKLTIKKTKVSIKKGKKYTIKAKFTKENKKLEAKRHTGLNGIRFESSNPSVAKVNNKGVVTGKKKGKATIYVYAQNGVCKKVKITVK